MRRLGRIPSMTDFRFTCLHCGQRLRCDARLAGRTVRCPGCRRAIALLPNLPPEGGATKTPRVPGVEKPPSSP